MNIKLTDKDRIQISNPDDLYDIMQRILLRDNKMDRDKEHFWIVGLNQVGIILYIELVSLGSTKKTLVEPMNVFRVAILKNATRVIAVHNHPSGSMKASEDDKDSTDRLIQVGRIIDIDVDDHLIISTTNYTSFRATGLMDELEKSLKYVPTYQLIEKIRKEEKAIAKDAVKTAKDEAKTERLRREKSEQALVAALIEKQVDIDQIAKILDISIKEVEKILKKKK